MGKGKDTEPRWRMLLRRYHEATPDAAVGHFRAVAVTPSGERPQAEAARAIDNSGEHAFNMKEQAHYGSDTLPAN